MINPYLSAFVTRSGQVLRFQILLCLAIVIVCFPDTYYGKQKVGLNWFAFWSLEAPRMQGGEGAGDLQHPNNNQCIARLQCNTVHCTEMQCTTLQKCQQTELRYAGLKITFHILVLMLNTALLFMCIVYDCIIAE